MKLNGDPSPINGSENLNYSEVEGDKDEKSQFQLLDQSKENYNIE